MNKKLIDWWIGSGSAYSSEYQAVLDRATTLGYTHPSSAQKSKHDTMVRLLKSDGTWAKLDALYIFLNDGSKEFGTLNWISPSANQVTIVGSMTWTSNAGFQGNGSSMYLNVGFNPATQGVQYTLNSSTFFVQYSNDVGSDTLDGSLSGGAIFMRPRGAANTCVSRVNDGANLSVASANGIGLFSIVRTASNARQAYRNGATLGSGDAQASTSIPSQNVFLGAYNNSGTPAYGGITQKIINSAGFGSGTINQSLLYTAINAYTSNP